MQGLQKLYLFSLLVQFLIFTHFSVHAQPAKSPAPVPTPPTHSPSLPPSPTPTPATHNPALPPPPAPVSPPPTPPTHTPALPPLPPPVGPHSPPKRETPPDSEGSSGLSGGQKAGIVIGVFAAVGVGWVGWTIHKKRRRNIRRARFGYEARRDMQL